MVDTDEIVRAAMEEEKQRKEAKAKAKSNAPHKRKGKTLAEIEQDEGGPVKESMAPMAHVKRAKKRKNNIDQGDDTDLPTNIEAAEEIQGVAEEDGIKFTGFNLREERTTGYFDEEGNYVERKNSDDEDAQDAWLQSDGGAVVSEAVRKRIEQQQQQQEAADTARPMTGRQLAELKANIVALMQPEETVPLLLKRLGGQGRPKGPLSKGSKNKKSLHTDVHGDAGGQIGGRTQDTETKGIDTDKGNKEDVAVVRRQIEMGETDIYDATKEELQRSIALYMPAQPSGAPNTTADDGDDMFASDDENTAKKAATATTSPPATTGGGTDRQAGDTAHMPAPVMPGVMPSTGGQHDGVDGDDGVDYASWPVKELRRFLQERGTDTVGIVEKEDLVSKVKEAAAAGPEQDIPLGYVYDTNSGYYYNVEAGLYYHAGSGTYFNGTAWYRWDGSRYVPAV